MILCRLLGVLINFLQQQQHSQEHSFDSTLFDCALYGNKALKRVEIIGIKPAIFVCTRPPRPQLFLTVFVSTYFWVCDQKNKNSNAIQTPHRVQCIYFFPQTNDCFHNIFFGLKQNLSLEKFGTGPLTNSPRQTC